MHSYFVGVHTTLAGADVCVDREPPRPECRETRAPTDPASARLPNSEAGLIRARPSCACVRLERIGSADEALVDRRAHALARVVAPVADPQLARGALELLVGRAREPRAPAVERAEAARLDTRMLNLAQRADEAAGWRSFNPELASARKQHGSRETPRSPRSAYAGGECVHSHASANARHALDASSAPTRM